MSLEERISAIRERIARCAEHTGRKGSEVRLVGVTKTRTVAEMREAAPLIDAIGENRVQEALSKKQEWGGEGGPEWRLIGHLQKNKARRAVEMFDSVDSVDSIGIASTLDRIAMELDRSLPVLIEVNTAGEASKTGIEPVEFPKLLDHVLNSPRLNLQGLMTIGPLTDDEAQVRRAFASLRELSDRARSSSGRELSVLSMGMSGDFEWGILEGSTMVRIGTALFGPR